MGTGKAQSRWSAVGQGKRVAVEMKARGSQGPVMEGLEGMESGFYSERSENYWKTVIMGVIVVDLCCKKITLVPVWRPRGQAGKP